MVINRVNFVLDSIELGYLDLLKCRFPMVDPCPALCASAALHGQLDVLKWLREPGIYHFPRCDWDKITWRDACQAGRINILKWARKNGCPVDDYGCCHAARCGQLETLKWLRKHGYTWGNLRYSNFMQTRSNPEILPWLRENGCPE